MSLKILVVDDAAFIRDMVKKAMRDYFPGSEISDANDGRKAQKKIQNTAFDLILSDWEMPEMTGEELLRWVRARDEEKKTKTLFIMISSRGDKEHVIKAIQSGVNDYISKPFSHDELIQKCSKVLSKGGKLPKRGKPQAPNANAQAMAFGADVLTSNTSAPKKPPQKKANALAQNKTKKPQSATPSKEKSESTSTQKRLKRPKGVASIRFPNHTLKCAIEKLNLQELDAIIKNGDIKPGILDQVVIDISKEEGSDVARLNGYVHALSANDISPDSTLLNITIRFVDKDQDKMIALSNYIERLG